MAKPTITTLESEINNLKALVTDLTLRVRRMENGLYAGMGSIILLLIGLLVR